MKFEIDNQTLKDIEIFAPKRVQRSIFDLFSGTCSVGGKLMLQKYLESQLVDLEIINDRKEAIAFFQTIDFVSELDIDKNTLDFIEHYLAQGDYPTQPPSKFRALEKSIQYKLNPTNNYYIIERGIDYVIDLLNDMHHFSMKLSRYACPKLISLNNAEIFGIFALPEFEKISEVKEMKKLTAMNIASFDYMFRYTHKDVILFFLKLIYAYDLFITVARVAAQNKFSYTEMLPEQDGIIELKGVFHPFICNSVKNDIRLSSDSNVLFLTGPNMAGKSSILKALSVSVYLAHIGFPVPARESKISLLAGLYTTINISDDLSLGYSHFYSEVLRIKSIVERLAQKSNMLIVFDELFRGTNVKDAYEGSLAIISALSKIKNCFFAISTHILEVAEHLPDKEAISFRYMEVVDHDGLPRYTYHMKEGISDARMGMYIIEKEKIIDTIEAICEKLNKN